jgi:hypothetical protein
MLCEAEKKIQSTEKQYSNDHKTKHIQYTVHPDTPMVVLLVKIFSTISYNLQFTTLFTAVYSSTIARCTISQNPFWYISIKSISILSSHIHKGLLNGFFPSFCNQNLFKSISPPCIPHPFCYCSFILQYLKSRINYWNFTLCIPFPPISSLFSSKFILITLFSNKTSC